MTNCVDFDTYAQFIQQFDQSVQINRDKDKDIRFNVWKTSAADLKKIFDNLNLNHIGAEDFGTTEQFKSKIQSFIERIQKSNFKAAGFKSDILDSENNIELSIALHELMESVKGEADKARNNGVEISAITNEGVLPAMPMARVAASIGRKIAYQKGYRFKKVNNQGDAESVETLYYTLGKNAIEQLEEKGYVNTHTSVPTIKDYLSKEDLGKKFPVVGKPTSDKEGNHVPSVSLSESKFGIVPGSAESGHFLNRSDSDLSNVELGTIVDMLKAARQITQPSTIVFPDTGFDPNRDLTANDEGNNDPKTDSAREKLYKAPLYLNSAVTDLLGLLHKTASEQNESASQVLNALFKDRPVLVQSLFGLKRSDDFSIDKKESVKGQNLSKTTPLDDLVEYFDVLTQESANPELHLPMKDGRNKRLYYENSVLNPHASKQMRYMLSSGPQKIKYGSDNFDYLVDKVIDALGGDLVYNDVVTANGSKLDGALELFAEYEQADTLIGKLAKVSHIAVKFKGVDYVTLLTSLKAVHDLRNPRNGTVTTEFTVSADATASGGTLTFGQALGENKNVESFLERIGLISNVAGNVSSEEGFDLYSLMTEATRGFIAGEVDTDTIATDPGRSAEDTKLLLEKTLDMLFNEGKDAREFSKDPTMTFVYGQGKTSATETIARSLGDRIIDNLDDLNTRRYLADLLGDVDYKTRESKALRETRGLYQDIVAALIDQGLPQKLYDLMDSSIRQKYLQEHRTNSTKLYSLLEKLPDDVSLKILPAGAVLAGIKPTQANLEKYGMPISKIFEVQGTTPDGDAILTRKEKLLKTVMDVSTIHSIDSAILYHAIDNVMGDNGLVVIHDDVRGTVKDVRAVEEEYRKVALQAFKEYDVHQQALAALEVYSPEIAGSSEYQTLKTNIDNKVENRNKILDSRFNQNTDALIGDGDRYKKTAANKGATTPVDKLPADEGIKAVITAVAERSPIVKRLLDLSPKFEKGEFGYTPSTDVISIGQNTSEVSAEKQTEMVEHEAVHAVTVNFLAQHKAGKLKDGKEKLAISYVENAVKRLRDITVFEDIDVSQQTKARIDYILSRPNDLAVTSEFLAIMGAESEAANEIYQALSGTTPTKTLRERIQKVIDGIRNYILNLTDDDFKQINADKLQIAILNTINSGISHREAVVQANGDYSYAVQGKFGYEAAATKKVEPEVSMRYLNYAFHTMINNRIERQGKTVVGRAHTLMKRYFPIYTDVANKAVGIYDESSALQQLMHTITGEGVDKSKKANILSQFSKVAEQQAETRNDQIDKLQTALAKSDADPDQVQRFVMDMPLHDYFLLSNGVDTVDKIGAEIQRLTAKMKGSPEVLRDVQRLIDWNVHGKDTGGKIYNLDTKYQMKGKESGSAEFSEDVRRLLALKSIQEIGAKDFVQFLENGELRDLVKEAVVANRISLLSVDGLSELPDSMMKSYTAEPVDVRAVTQEELKRYNVGEETGWKVLRPGTKNELALVYRHVIDSTDIPGAYTDIKLLSDDISLPKSKSGFKGVVATQNGYKLRLTQEEKQTLGVQPGFVEALAHTVSHNMAIQDSQVIRNELLKAETRYEVSGKDDKKLMDIIDAPNVENPWFLKLPDELTLADLDPKIRSKYQIVGGRASNVGNFNAEVSLVRKDISHWLMGGHAKGYFQSPKMKWATRILKDLVAGSKIGMIVLNPVKIANDNLSNIAYLGVVGVDPIDIAKHYRDIVREYGEYSSVKGELLRLKIRLMANPESTELQKRSESLTERLKKNPLHDLDEKGFVNSLGSSLIGKNTQTLTGFQADANTALQYLLKRKDGKNNILAHFIFQLQDLGFHGEDYIRYLGNIVGAAETTAEAEKQLDKVAERLRTIRSERDIVNYVAQYTTSPSSELVRMGSAATDLSDVLAKETLYRHLTANEGLSPEAAKIKVLDSFPDYKENMPLAVRQMSDLGILLFPSFWMRIQKVIYRMAKEKPVGLGTEMLIQEALGSDVNTILESNIIEKYNSFGGIFHNPADIVGMNSFVPTQMW